MQFLSRWVLPVAFVGIGSSILFGFLFPAIPASTGLRPILGIVVILMGVHRFVVSRYVKPHDRRPYGGEHRKPWEDS
ncbi:MAG: hypothetical protein PHI18_07635 [bacterium]|nr:hypothetical protein [bacterium]